MHRFPRVHRWSRLPLVVIAFYTIALDGPAGAWPDRGQATRIDERTSRNRQSDPRGTDAKVALDRALSILTTDGDKESALEWFRRAADQGSASAKFHLAYLYWRPTDPALEDDEALALRLTLEVAKGGDPYAAVRVGEIFQGSLDRKDLAEARGWYEVAARGGLSNAAWRIGWMFEHGLGVRRDLVEAYKWYDIGSHLTPLATEPNEVPGIARRRDDLASRMSAEEISRAEVRSRSWLSKVTSYDSCNARRNRIRVAVSVPGAKGVDFAAWVQNFEARLNERLVFPPCSGIEGRAVVTKLVSKDGSSRDPGTWRASPLDYFNSALSAALWQIPSAPLPSGFPDEFAEVVVQAFYNEMPLP